ncbi:hypothetical protein R1flu_027485 [Riccia fluitans]|uniref:Uncharacterized protein n=1 Tax=Riccia fluitans TaxID=41844 RepID=A0ABD1XIZ2_9MARC
MKIKQRWETMYREEMNGLSVVNQGVTDDIPDGHEKLRVKARNSKLSRTSVVQPKQESKMSVKHKDKKVRCLRRSTSEMTRVAEVACSTVPSLELTLEVTKASEFNLPDVGGCNSKEHVLASRSAVMPEFVAHDRLARDGESQTSVPTLQSVLSVLDETDRYISKYFRLRDPTRPSLTSTLGVSKEPGTSLEQSGIATRPSLTLTLGVSKEPGTTLEQSGIAVPQSQKKI